MKLKEPEIRRFRLAEIRPAKYNPHTISDEALAGLTASLKRFGCVEPVVVNIRGGKNTIIGGHQRHKALIKLHGDKYECLCVAVSLDAAEEKLLNLTLNNPKAQGEFIEGLAEYIDRLKKEIGDDALAQNPLASVDAVSAPYPLVARPIEETVEDRRPDYRDHQPAGRGRQRRGATARAVASPLDSKPIPSPPLDAGNDILLRKAAIHAMPKLPEKAATQMNAVLEAARKAQRARGESFAGCCQRRCHSRKRRRQRCLVLLR